jgi:hypothetical protein
MGGREKRKRKREGRKERKRKRGYKGGNCSDKHDGSEPGPVIHG